MTHSQGEEVPASSARRAAEDWHRVLVEWNDTAAEYPSDQCVHELFGEWVDRTPAATALVFRGQLVTYTELNAQANRLANHLVALGMRRGELVGIYLERGPQLVVALLAVLKTGAGFAVLDTDLPAARVNAVLTDTAAGVVVSRRELTGQLATGGVTHVLVDADAAWIGQRSGADVALDARPGDVACVLYSPELVGRPKGIVASHRGIVGSLFGPSPANFGPDEVVLQCAHPTSPAFIQELFGALLFGGTCVLQPGNRPDPRQIAALVHEHAVSILQLPPGVLPGLLDEHPTVFRTVRTVLIAGKPAATGAATSVLGRHPAVRLVAGYSPVENLTLTTSHQVGERDVTAQAVPLGRPVANRQVFVLDERLAPVPTGAVGELYVTGVGLAYGYLKQPALTAARFVANPFGRTPGERMYRTGDLVRWRPDGELEHLGRTGDGEEIRGVRVEPAEVEAALGRHPSVAGAAVVVREDRPGDKRLVAYLVPAAGVRFRVAGVRAHLAEQLPDHLMPAAFVLLDALPVGPDGTVQRAALPAPELAATPPEQGWPDRRGPRRRRRRLAP